MNNADRLLEELEESIPQGRVNDTQLAVNDEDSGFGELDSLDALLKESMGAVEAERQYKADRERAKKGYAGMSKEEVEFCNSRMRAFEMAKEWDADGCIAVFIGYHCQQCDTVKTVFSRLMEHHQHRRNATTSRWVTVKESTQPMMTVYDQKEVPMCEDCVASLGCLDPLDETVPWLEEVLNNGRK